VFANTPTGKQITIHMSQPGARPAAAPARPATSGPARPQTPKSAAARKKLRNQKKAEQDAMFSRSELAKNNPFAKNAMENDPESNTVSNFLSRVFVQNIASNGTIILGMVFTGCLIITAVITSKGFLCPDLAVDANLNTAWYCQASNAEKDDKL